MHSSYKTTGTCAQRIEFDLDNGIIHNVRFIGGCPGNTIGVAKLVEGMEASKAIEILAGIRCGMKPTSCPDQLANALKVAIK